MTTEILKLDEIVASQAQKEVPHNTALRQIEGWIRALSMTTTAPPGTPAAGDTYIVPAGATGAWAGQDNKLAHYYGGSWKFRTPPKGVRTFVLDEGAAGVEYVFDNTGAWVANGGDVSADIEAAMAAHVAEEDPHPAYLTQAEADALYAPTGDGTTSLAAHVGAADPHTQYQKESEKGAADGYAPLGSDGKVPASYLPTTTGGGGSPAGIADTVPSLSEFSWVNQGGATATQQTFGISLLAPSSSADSCRCLVTPVPASANFTMTVRIRFSIFTQNYMHAGIALYNSSSGKVTTYGPTARDGGPRYVGISWNSPTAYSADWAGDNAVLLPFEWYRFRFASDGYLYTEVSPDGAAWVTVRKDQRNIIITPTHIGIVANPKNAVNLGMAMALLSWSVTQQ